MDIFEQPNMEYSFCIWLLIIKKLFPKTSCLVLLLSSVQKTINRQKEEQFSYLSGRVRVKTCVKYVYSYCAVLQRRLIELLHTETGGTLPPCGRLWCCTHWHFISVFLLFGLILFKTFQCVTHTETGLYFHTAVRWLNKTYQTSRDDQGDLHLPCLENQLNSSQLSMLLVTDWRKLSCFWGDWGEVKTLKHIHTNNMKRTWTSQ